MNDTYPFVNTPLPYAYNALEPYIDTETMRLHHDAHLGKYISDLNEVLAKYPALQKMSLEELLSLPGCRAYPQARFRPRIILPPADALKLCRSAEASSITVFFSSRWLRARSVIREETSPRR